MQFNSIQYLIFLSLILSAFFCLPRNYRWPLLLGASYYFYMCWKAEFVVLIIVSTLVDYFAAILMNRKTVQREKRKYLLFSIITNLGILFSFKYFNFFNGSIRSALNSINVFYDVPVFDLLLPIGISFYTFQSMAYSIEVYRGTIEPERNLGIFALYVAFFPQLVAGPIERAGRLIPQLKIFKPFDCHRAASGLRQILWGLFKKIVIADRLAAYVDVVYAHPGNFPGQTIWLATVFFAFQIYCDFSGYSDIAIGSARMMGIDLMTNFHRPYFADSIRDFWRRWHISLSTWFKDYVYIPLGGSRVVKWRWYYNLMITFVISGLWHGAAWTFVLWGALHGLYFVISILMQKPAEAFYRAVRLSAFPRLFQLYRILTTFALVCFAWIFFRAEGLQEALVLAGRSFKPDPSKLGLNLLGMDHLAGCLLLIGLIISVHCLQTRFSLDRLIAGRPVWLRWGFYYTLITIIIIFGVYEQRQFIYFQF